MRAITKLALTAGIVLATACSATQSTTERAYSPRTVSALGATENRFRNACNGKTDFEVQRTNFKPILAERDNILVSQGQELGKEYWRCERANGDPSNHQFVIYPK